MPEPTSSAGISLAVLSIALFGPLAGPWALIVFAALCGAMWPLSTGDTGTRLAGAWLLVRCTLTAVVLTAALANLAEQFWKFPASEAWAPVAFLIGALGNGWRPVFDAFGRALGAVLGRAGGGQ